MLSFKLSGTSQGELSRASQSELLRADQGELSRARASYQKPSFASAPIPMAIIAIPSRQTSTRARYDSFGDEHSRPRRARTTRVRRSTRDTAFSSDEEYFRPRRGIRATIRNAINRRIEARPRRQPRRTPECIYVEDSVRVRRTSSPDPVYHRVSRPTARPMAPSYNEDSDYDWSSDGYLTSPDQETTSNCFRRAEAFTY